MVPSFPLIAEPGDLDALTLWAESIFLEAESEPFLGKLGVGYALRTRCDEWKLTPHAAILGPDGKAYGDGRPFEVLSCWNDDYRDRARARLAAANGPELEDAWRAAAAALWRLLPSPVADATHYLNVPLTLKIRGGTLPTWAAAPGHPDVLDLGKVREMIGKHTFLRA